LKRSPKLDYVAAQLCRGSEFLAYDNRAYQPLPRDPLPASTPKEDGTDTLESWRKPDTP